MTTTPRSGNVGRPMDARIDEAILKTTIQQLSERGFAQLTIEGVARDAGVGKTAIYRRWTNKDELVVAAVGRFLSPHPVVHTDNPKRDLQEFLDTMSGTRLASPLSYAMLAVAADHHRHEQMAQRLAAFLDPRLDQAVEILDRAVRAGELRAGIDTRLLVETMVAQPIYHWLRTGRGSTPHDNQRLIDLIWQLAGTTTPVRETMPPPHGGNHPPAGSASLP